MVIVNDEIFVMAGVDGVTAEVVVEDVVVEVAVQSEVMTRQGHREEEAGQRKRSVHLSKDVNQY